MVPSQTCQFMTEFLLSAFPEHLHNLQAINIPDFRVLPSLYNIIYTIYNLLAAEVFIYCFGGFFVSFLAFMLPFFISVYLKSKPDSLTNDPQQILMSGFPKDSKGYPKRSCCVYSLLWLRE